MGVVDAILSGVLALPLSGHFMGGVSVSRTVVRIRSQLLMKACKNLHV